MIIALTRPLFPWDALEDSPTLGTIRTFLATIPDASLLDSLRRARGKGPKQVAGRSQPRLQALDVGKHCRNLEFELERLAQAAV